MKQMRLWADEAPSNFLGKLYLLEAEWASLFGRNDQAHRRYISAAALLKESGFYLQTALSLELAGKHFARIREDGLAVRFLRQALDKYREWGGHAKADHLETEVKHILYTQTST